MNHRTNRRIDHKNKGYKVKISDTNKILQRYRNSALTYDLIRKIVYDIWTNSKMVESTILSNERAPMKMDNNDIMMIYE